MNKRTIVLAALLGLGMAGPLIMAAAVSAETIAQFATGPGRGMSMKQVETRYGEPSRRYASVGDPPITRWEYADFVVYFEYRYVIHSVSKKKSG
ncbi:MAG: hypothetical protein O7C03_04830 [Gammaproteobacteria bacterium]|nr:hypothetical protein [Gammaproteobacteria bacterium]